MDFVVGLTSTQCQNDYVWFIVDRMTKSSHFVPVKPTYSAKDYAKLYLNEIVRMDGVPFSIISDRNTQFTFRFCKAFQTGLGTKKKLSTAFNPQTYCLAEGTIQTLKDMLRASVIYLKGHLDDHLPLTEFAFYNNYHSSIAMALFESLYGRRYRSLIG